MNSTALEEVLEPTVEYIKKELIFNSLCKTLYPFSHPDLVMGKGDVSLVADSLIYNEVPFGCVYKALGYLQEIGELTENKIFMDVGSGIGKALFMVLAIYPWFGKYIGIEIYEPRHKSALYAKHLYEMKTKEIQEELVAIELKKTSDEIEQQIGTIQKIESQKVESESKSIKECKSSSNQDSLQQEEEEGGKGKHTNKTKNASSFARSTKGSERKQEIDRQNLMYGREIEFLCDDIIDFEEIGKVDIFLLIATEFSNDTMERMSRIFESCAKIGSYFITLNKPGRKLSSVSFETIHQFPYKTPWGVNIVYIQSKTKHLKDGESN